ncbi:type II toxin-antitoxin system RelB/DinJ family antitoxin [Acinetobacter sp. MD2]|uniref:type II toxin-antitoxin system RelB/DinJ family antitoxin n=1 Tax=Acinetobacter sp. MD2 TaxID=2600066 RepID=UPI002D1EF125|nr:type II toxin-antitoxin system RelB/DinJ family antitoxin [Acinetobacter sp. MD2]MEB3766670.1 type II toxin-antitoxin system RelB/DinJ family antitoxin [Acinetobacter sp. MD2]
MRKSEVYQVRLDSQEKKQAFAVFKQLGITPAQAVRLFFKQVVLTKSIPFAIENQNIDMEQLLKLRHRAKATQTSNEQIQTIASPTLSFEPEDDDLFDELSALLNDSERH